MYTLIYKNCTSRYKSFNNAYDAVKTLESYGVPTRLENEDTHKILHDTLRANHFRVLISTIYKMASYKRV